MSPGKELMMLLLEYYTGYTILMHVQHWKMQLFKVHSFKKHKTCTGQALVKKKKTLFHDKSMSNNQMYMIATIKIFYMRTFDKQTLHQLLQMTAHT